MPYIKQRAYDDLAWAAGFFDGEGCTTMMRHKRAPWSFIVQVKQVELQPLLRFRAAIGEIGVVYTEKRKDRSDIHQLRLVGREAMQAMGLLWPWLSEPKKQQYEAQLAEWRLARDRWVEGQQVLEEVR